MYTYNNFVFGHNLSINKELNNSLHEFDICFSTRIGLKKFEISTPYHGGKCSGDTQSVILGVLITDDDNNTNYIDEVRNAKEEDYIHDYNIFLDKFKAALIEDKGHESDYDEVADNLIEFLDTNKPGFYSVQASS
ncbi:MAG: hypothetical protein H0X63_00015 [Flavobacteriales bacterium]|nr:hypothetical protein [Flavobacteriales bacterium]